MIKKLLPCVGKYKLQTLLAPATIIGEVFLEIQIPYLMAGIIDVGIKNSDIGYVLSLGGRMALMAVLSLILGALSGRFASVAGAGFAKNLRARLFGRISDFSFANVDRFSTASLVTRLTTDVTNAQNSFMMAIRIMVRAPIMLVSATFMAVSINRRLSLVFLVAIPLLAASLIFIIIKAFPRFQVLLKKYDEMNSSVQENLIAMRVVKAFVRKDFENKKFTDAASALQAAQLKAERIIIFNMPVMQFAMYGCMIAVAWFGGNFVIRGEMETGALFSFLSYISQILMSLMMLSMIFVMLVISRASVARISEVLDETPDINDDGAVEGLFVEDGSVEFKNVSFSYSKSRENITLSGINLSITAGETVGIIGGTGSAKTTLVQLIPRLYGVLDGSVSVGGRDVREYKLSALRDSVAMVLQKNVLFSGSIKENLLWGNPSATQPEIEAACKAAQAHDFIMSFPDGYETSLGQGGVNLSGGQKQRLCIARALVKNPKILILDDSTSAVDTATDSRLRAAFKTQLSKTTVIIIAQRIASVMEADKIVVLDEGKISAVGTHEELLQKSEIYREVYESQQRGVA